MNVVARLPVTNAPCSGGAAAAPGARRAGFGVHLRDLRDLPKHVFPITRAPLVSVLAHQTCGGDWEDERAVGHAVHGVREREAAVHALHLLGAIQDNGLVDHLAVGLLRIIQNTVQLLVRDLRVVQTRVHRVQSGFGLVGGHG